VWDLAAAGEMVAKRRPPRDLEHVIKHVLLSAGRRRLDFHARLFAVEPVEDADDQREQCSRDQVSRRE